MLKALATGFSRDAVVALSRQKGEPEWMLQQRLQAWELYESTPAPLGRRGDLGTLRTVANFKFDQLSPYVPSDQNEALPPIIEQSLSQALVGRDIWAELIKFEIRYGAQCTQVAAASKRCGRALIELPGLQALL